MRATFAFLLWTRASAVFRPARLRDVHVSSDGLLQGFDSVDVSRELQFSNGTTTACSICGNFSILTDFTPFYDPTNITSDNTTCGEYNFIAGMVAANNVVCSQFAPLFPFCCRGPPTYQCETEIRRSLLNGYDNTVIPRSNFSTPCVVQVSLTYLTATELDVQSGTAEIFVWLDLTWNDPRLAWSVNRKNCIDIISMRASLNADLTEIWVPDLDLFNAVNGVQKFNDALADIYPDGTVNWRRSGELKAVCQFSGLAKIPFDLLGCQFIMGPWTRLTSGHVKYELDSGTGFSFGDFESTYNEFKLLQDRVETSVDERGIISYVFYFQRATSYYIFNIVVPTILLTYVSFGTFLLDLRVGERLSFGMALTLVLVAQQIVTSDLLPVSDAYLWIEKFVGWSFYWVIFGLVESVLVGYIFFIREDVSIEAMDSLEKAERKLRASQVPTNPPEGDTTPEEQVDGQDIVDSMSGPDATPTLDTVTNNLPVAPDEGDQPKVHKTLKQRLMRKSARENMWVPKPKTLPHWMSTFPLRKIDHICFFFTTISYSIFILVMFLTVPSWGTDIDPDYEE